MSRLIAVTGKGGVGKTTVSALLVTALVRQGKTPVLAIDADPNSCLDAALGVEVKGTVGRAREETRKEAEAAAASGLAKQELLRMKIAESLVESTGFDLIAMGRPEGAGCYCYANNVLKSVIAELSGAYPYVVLDNEAGLENLSRRIVQKVDVLALCSDPSRAGLETLRRLYDLAAEMEIGYDKLVLIINRLRAEPEPSRFDEICAYTHADELLLLPDDEAVARHAEEAKPLLDIAEGHPLLKRLEILATL